MLAVEPQPVLVVRHRREQDLAAEAIVERIQLELADRCFGQGIGLRAPPGRADELRQEQLVEVWVALPIDLVERLLEDFEGIGDPVREPERAAELERDRAAPRPVGKELETGAQVVGRGRPVRPPLRTAELDQHLRPCGRIDVLIERAGEIADAASAAPWASERSAAWRSVETRNESARGATRSRCPAALSGGAPAWSSSSAAERCAAARSTTSSVS